MDWSTSEESGKSGTNEHRYGRNDFIDEKASIKLLVGALNICLRGHEH